MRCVRRSAEVATDQPFAQAYVHSGMVGLDGEKMSKSKGNLVFVSTLRGSGVDPMAIRLALLAHHYRDDWDWTAELLDSAHSRLSLWREAVRLDAGLNADEVLVQVRRALAHDLDARRLRWLPWTRGQEPRSRSTATTLRPQRWSPAPATRSSAWCWSTDLSASQQAVAV